MEQEAKIDKAFHLINMRFFGRGTTDLSKWRQDLVDELMGLPMPIAGIIITKYMCALTLRGMEDELSTVESWIIPEQNKRES